MSSVIDQITALAGRRETLISRQFELQTKVSTMQSADQSHMIDWLQSLTIDDFWQLDDLLINQSLHRLFGKLRFFVEDGQIISVGIPARRRGKPFRK